MITDCYTPGSEPVISPRDIYGEPGHVSDICLALLSDELHDHLLRTRDCRKVAAMKDCNGGRSIYTFEHDGLSLSFYLSYMGSALAAHQLVESAWLTGSSKYIMFGSAGTLDPDATDGRYVVPTAAYRGEGTSYYFLEPGDYIDVPGSARVAEIFEAAGIPHVKAPVWTTDMIYRETAELVNKRKSEGCVAVEMELAGMQAACDHYGFSLYHFLETGDVVIPGEYAESNLMEVNHRLGNLSTALLIASAIAEN